MTTKVWGTVKNWGTKNGLYGTTIKQTPWALQYSGNFIGKYTMFGQNRVRPCPGGFTVRFRNKTTVIVFVQGKKGPRP